VLRVDEKHLREHAVLNRCGVIITSNHKTDGIYLPPDDRRHFVAWSDLTKEEFAPAYWNGMWEWYSRGGHGHVAAYLAGLDISGFDPKARSANLANRGLRSYTAVSAVGDDRMLLYQPVGLITACRLINEEDAPGAC
jgi:hypothetical protein